MKNIILIAVLLICSSSTLAETSLCTGTWANGQPVRVMVDWDNGKVNINGVVTKIIKATSEGIYTSDHINKFGHSVAFGVVSSTYNAYSRNGMYLYSSVRHGTFVIQSDLDTNTANFSYGLSCSKSFTKSLMARVL